MSTWTERPCAVTLKQSQTGSKMNDIVVLRVELAQYPTVVIFVIVIHTLYALSYHNPPFSSESLLQFLLSSDRRADPIHV